MFFFGLGMVEGNGWFMIYKFLILVIVLFTLQCILFSGIML